MNPPMFDLEKSPALRANYQITCTNRCVGLCLECMMQYDFVHGSPNDHRKIGFTYGCTCMQRDWQQVKKELLYETD